MGIAGQVRGKLRLALRLQLGSRMKRSSTKKLRLSRTTIQRLDLANVAGAAPNTYTLCTTTTINTIGNCPSATCTVLQGCTLWPCITVGTYDC